MVMSEAMSIFSGVIEELSSEIERIIERESTCGLSIAIVDDKKILWAKGFGYTDLNRKERVTAETLFSSQSFGKCLTATAFLIMVSKNFIGLDDPLRKYYPKFKINTKFGDQETEIDRITFRRMLSHWAGFTHEALVGNNYTENGTFEEHIESISEGWLKSPVGSELSYSNLGSRWFRAILLKSRLRIDRLHHGINSEQTLRRSDERGITSSSWHNFSHIRC
jgi:CubicO group peptidase (beta-lactamase class C family)